MKKTILLSLLLSLFPLNNAVSDPSVLEAGDFLIMQKDRIRLEDSLKSSVFRAFVENTVFSSQLLFDGAVVAVDGMDDGESLFLTSLSWIGDAKHVEIEIEDKRIEASIKRKDEGNNIALLSCKRLPQIQARKLAKTKSPLAFSLVIIDQGKTQIVEGSYSIQDSLRYGETNLRLSNGYPLFNAKGELLALAVGRRADEKATNIVHHEILGRFFENEPIREKLEKLDFVQK